MSYLSFPRLTLSGRFQCDVSTVNNDVRHFDNATFEERFQDNQTTDWQGVSIENGWWNPGGSGSLRLVDVRVRRAQTQADEKPGFADPAEGLFLASQTGRTSAKLVDLDPQWQTASVIFGMRVVLTDGQTEFMSARYDPAPFRDLYFGRVPGVSGDTAASAKFTSHLTDVAWTEAADASPTLRALRALSAANGDRLAVSLMTYAFVGNSASPDFTFGRITASIGGWQDGQPKSFVAGRRFAPAGHTKYLGGGGAFATPEGIGFFDADLSGATDEGGTRTLSLDLSNALPMTSIDGSMKDLGTITVAVLKTPDTVSPDGKITPCTVENDAVTLVSEPGKHDGAGALAVAIGTLPYRVDGWLEATGGIADLAVTGAAAELIDNHPIALIAPGRGGIQRVLIRETYGGFFLRADDFQKRMDTLADKPVAAETKLYATRYGHPLTDRDFAFELSQPMAGQGVGSPTAAQPPKADIPVIGTPTDKLRFAPTVSTSGTWSGTVPIYALNPGTPRGYIDGQIYLLEYTLAGLTGLSPMPIFENICIHVRDAFDVLEAPDWDKDLKPILQQYDNLYPVMGRGLFNLANAEDAARYARIFYLSFAQEIDNPNQMPATRDLSAQKRQSILNWLAQHVPPAMLDGPYEIPPQPVPFEGSIPPPGPVEGETPKSTTTDLAGETPVAAIGKDTGGKAVAVALFLEERKRQANSASEASS